MKPTDPSFGVEPERLHGLLTTATSVDDKSQTYEPTSKKYVGRYPTVPGHWLGFYENLARAVRGTEDIAVRAEQSRDGIRTVELARLSHLRGETVLWA